MTTHGKSVQEYQAAVQLAKQIVSSKYFLNVNDAITNEQQIIARMTECSSQLTKYLIDSRSCYHLLASTTEAILLQLVQSEFEYYTQLLTLISYIHDYDPLIQDLEDFEDELIDFEVLADRVRYISNLVLMHAEQVLYYHNLLLQHELAKKPIPLKPESLSGSTEDTLSNPSVHSPTDRITSNCRNIDSNVSMSHLNNTHQDSNSISRKRDISTLATYCSNKLITC
jgi:hypothetical protein